jgi:small GTP-binding protein
LFDITHIFKVIVIGPGSVGKTSIIRRFVEGSFSLNYTVTIGTDFLSKVIEFDNIKARIQIWDIGGQERFRFLRKSFYKGATGAVLVFDLTRSQTFNEMQSWLYEMYQIMEEKIPFILVGNKTDLIEEKVYQDNQSKEQIFAKKESSIYINTSAKTGENIEKAFIELIKRMMK